MFKFSLPNRTDRQKSLNTTLLRLVIIPSVTVLLVLVALVALAAFLLQRQVREYHLLSVATLVRQAEQYLGETERAMDMIVSGLQDASQAEQQVVLARARESYPRFSALFVLDNNGQVIVEETDSFNLQGLDLSRETFFVVVQDTGLTYFSNSFISLANDQVSVTAAVPIKNANGYIEGVLVGELNLTRLQEAIEGVSFGQNGYPLIVDQRRTVVAHPNLKRVQTRENLGRYTIFQGDMQQTAPSLRIFYDDELNGWFVGNAQLMSNGWAVATIQPLLDATRSLWILFWMAVLAFIGSLVLFVGVQSHGLRRITSTISQLTRKADVMAQGDYATAAELDVSQFEQFEEIASLNQSFTHMAQVVRDRDLVLEERVAVRTQRLEFAALVGEQINTILNPDQIIYAVLDLINTYYKYYFVSVWMITPDGCALVMTEGTSTEDAPIIPLDAPVSIIAKSARTGQVICVNNTTTNKLWLYADQFPRTRSELALPIEAEGQAIAILDIQEDMVDAFDDNEIDLFRSVAIQMSIAMQNARLYTSLENLVQARTAQLSQANQAMQLELEERHRIEAEIQHRNRDLALLNQVIAAAASHESLDDILQVTCNETAAAFGVAFVVVNLYQPKLTIVGPAVPAERLTVFSLPQIVNPRYNQFQHFDKPFVIEDLQQDSQTTAHHAFFVAENLSGLLVAPLLIEDQTVGTLALLCAEVRQFSAQEISLAWNIANQIASLLQRTRLADERERLSEQFRQAQKMEAIGLLAGGVAHDFNNLLTSINGFAELLERQLSDPDSSLTRYVQQIRYAGQRAADLTGQLLTFSRKQVVAPQVMDLNDVVTKMHSILRRTIGEHIDLKLHLADNLMPVKVDRGQVEQVLLNLVVNARDAMPNGGKLSIELANETLTADQLRGQFNVPAGDYVRLAVSDTGVGISPELQEHIFEPFFTTKETGKGTGLGLATIFGIVKQNKGDIAVHSEPGVGSTFRILFPGVKDADANQVTKPVPTTAQPLPTGAETVLLAEDNPTVRDLAMQTLNEQGYHLFIAEDGLQALQTFSKAQGRIDLLLTDVIMPGLGGKDLADELLRRRPGLKIIFMSGYTDQIIADTTQLGRGVRFLQKPFSPAYLARLVREVLDE